MSDKIDWNLVDILFELHYNKLTIRDAYNKIKVLQNDREKD